MVPAARTDDSLDANQSGKQPRGLSACDDPVFLDDRSRDAAAVLDFDALFLGPLADLHSVDGAIPALGPGSALGRAGPPCVPDVPLQGIAQFFAVPGAEVDLVFRGSFV